MKDQEINNKLEKLKLTLDFLKLEATVDWQIFNAFLIGNNIFIVIIATLYSKDDNNYLLFAIIGFVGILISALWFFTFRRNTDWYRYRMRQAKKAETDFVNAINDNEWYLLNRDAENFANGSKIKGFKNKTTGFGMIIIYMLLYGILIFFSLFQILSKCYY